MYITFSEVTCILSVWSIRKSPEDDVIVSETFGRLADNIFKLNKGTSLLKNTAFSFYITKNVEEICQYAASGRESSSSTWSSN